MPGSKTTASPKPRLLVVAETGSLEDIESLESAGHELIWQADTALALEWLQHGHADAVLLQLRNGDGERLDLLDALRKTEADHTPVIIISPADALDLRVSALNRGANDYVVQPLSATDLLARLATTLRRHTQQYQRYLRLGKLVIDRKTARFGDGMKWTWLTPKEWRLFAAFLEHPDQAISRQGLKQVVAGERMMSDSALEAMISRLRTKSCEWGLQIRMMRGVGYILEAERDELVVAP